MKSTIPQVLLWGLVVLYGGIALLDEGLHELLPGSAHHHYHGLGLVGAVTG